MGGTRSGERSYSRSRTSNYYRIDVRSWQRRGLLLVGKSFVDQWFKIAVAPYADDIPEVDHAIVSSFMPLYSGVESILCFAWTRCNYGGSRAWFLCQNRRCRRRVAILYSSGGTAFACRHCLKLAYDSQQECTRLRRLHRAQAIRMKLGGDPSLAGPFPNKPKGMHRKTYRKFLEKALAYEAWFFGDLASRLP
jgi:hypothetical protein